MNTGQRWERGLLYFGIIAFLLLFHVLLSGNSKVNGSSEICAGLGLLLAVAALLYLRQMQIISRGGVADRIRAEYAAEVQPQAFEVYERLKVKELQDLFPKILDEAHGDINQVKKLGAIAERMGSQVFLENKW
jgi:hypothetical protein